MVESHLRLHGSRLNLAIRTDETAGMDSANNFYQHFLFTSKRKPNITGAALPGKPSML